MRLFEHSTTIGTGSTRVWVLGISIPLPFAPASDATRVLPDEDDPATLARLEAIMSDSVRTCPRCGRETPICQTIGCNPDDVSQLATLNA
jgi:hypothetical protein